MISLAFSKTYFNYRPTKCNGDASFELDEKVERNEFPKSKQKKFNFIFRWCGTLSLTFNINVNFTVPSIK